MNFQRSGINRWMWKASKFTAFDPVTRRALLKFWIAAPGIVLAAVILYYLSRGRIEPRIAILAAIAVGVATLFLLFIMNRSLLSMHLLTRTGALVDKRLDKILSQLDDRFAIFSHVQAGDHRVDHIIIGPSGVYTIKTSATLDKDGWARAGDIEQLLVEDNAVNELIHKTVPQSTMPTQSVLCVPQGSTIRVDQEDRGVWIVAADKLAVSLIKRSTAEGAIGQNVNETGAFSSDTMQAAAIERALAHHWNIPTRHNRTDYAPPPDLTGDTPRRRQLSSRLTEHSCSERFYLLKLKLSLPAVITTALLTFVAIAWAGPDEMNDWLKTNAIDSAAGQRKDESELQWYNGTSLTLEGRAFEDTQTSYSRLETRRQNEVTHGVWYAANCSAGVTLRFVTDSPEISVAWEKVRQPMSHMAWTGSGGLDLYAREDNKWVYRGTGKPTGEESLAVVQRANGHEQVATEYLMFLPLYSPVNKLEIGISSGNSISPGPDRYSEQLPLVFYGTSITQGE